MTPITPITFNTLHNHEAKMNQRGAEYPAWIAICLAAGVRTYVEVGCGVGRGILRFREAGIEALGIDLCPHAPSIFEEERPGDLQLHYIAADSSSEEAVQLTELKIGTPDAVFLDADHSYGKAKMDYMRWWPNARLLLGFHDILIDGDAHIGRLWNELKYDTRSLELLSRDRRSVLEWQGQGCLDASPDGRLTAGGIGVLFKQECGG
jgi:SAM-dependent methyltransferase